MLLRSAGVDPASLSFAFRPLWQMDAAASAQVALQKAQASQIYAGMNLWPAAVTARLVQSQLVENAAYRGAAGLFAEAVAAPQPATDFDPAQPRDPDGRWTGGSGSHSQSDPADPPMASTLDDCASEWDHAYRIRAQLLLRPNPSRRMTGGHRTLQGCAKGFVSARCGGNAV